MHNGTILRVSKSRDFGYIGIPGRKADLWFHVSDLRGIEVDDQLIGRRVVCEIGDGTKGPRAVDVRPA